MLWISAFALLVTAVAFANVRNPEVGFDKFSLPKELSFQVVTLILCVKLLNDRRAQQAISRSLASWPSCFLIGFVAWSIISWLAVATNNWAASRAVGLSASMVTLWLMVGGSRERDVLKIVALTVAVLSSAGIASILDARGLFPGLSMPQRGPGGVFGNRNYASHVFVLALPACWYLFRRARRTQHLVSTSLAAALVIAPIVFGRSRGAWLGVAAALAGGMLAAFGVRWRGPTAPSYNRRARVFRHAVLMVGIVGGVLAGQLIAAKLWVLTPHPLADTASRIVDAGAGSGHDRLIQYSTTLRIIRDRSILGVGPGNWNVAYARYASNDDRSFDRTAMEPVNRFASSDILDLAAERGVIGVGLLLAAIVSAWLASLHGSRFRFPELTTRTNTSTHLVSCSLESGDSPKESEDAQAKADQFVALTALFCAYLTMAMVDSLIVQAPAAVVIAIFAGAWAKARTERSCGKAHTRSIPVLPRILFGLPLALLLLTASRVARSLFVVVMYSGNSSLADLSMLTAFAPGDYSLHVVVATRAAKVGDCRLMRDQIEKADSLYPFRPLQPLFRARCPSGSLRPPAPHPDSNFGYTQMSR